MSPAEARAAPASVALPMRDFLAQHPVLPFHATHHHHHPPLFFTDLKAVEQGMVGAGGGVSVLPAQKMMM